MRGRTFVSPMACLVVLLAILSVAWAQETKEEEGVRLSLADCLRTALQNNLDLVIARKDPKIAALNVNFEAAAFDPAMDASVNHTESKDEPSASFQSARAKNDNASANWVDRLHFGGKYTIGLSSQKTDAPNPFRRYNPSYTSSLALSYQMPLLRGFGSEATTQALLVARSNLDISREDLRRQAHASLKQVEDAYWELVAAREALDVARQSFKLAHDLLELNQKKVEVGTLAPIEITQAQAGVAAREEGVIVAETGLENSEDNLRQLLAIPKDDPTWDQRLVPTDEPRFEPKSTALDASIAKALEARPELVAARKNLAQRKLGERVARNGTRHGLDFSASLIPNGNNLKEFVLVAGTDGIFGTADDDLVPVTGGVGESLSEVPKFRNHQWTVGLTYSVPLGNHAAKAGYAIATLNREKAEVGLQNLEQTVRVDVRTAVRNVVSGNKRVNAARASTVLQQKKLEAEQKKFQNGMSTSFEVLTFQNDLANAQLSEIRALIDYNKSLADLERAQGTLLESRGLTLGDEKGM